MFKIKLGYLNLNFLILELNHLALLTPKTVKLLGSTERSITKKNGENIPLFEIPEIILVHCIWTVAQNFTVKIHMFNMSRYFIPFCLISENVQLR